MRNERREGLEIDLQKLLGAYIRKWWLIAAAVVVAALVTLYVTANFITPMYEAEVKVYVNNVRSGQDMDSVTNANLATAQKLVNTYITIIESDSVLEKVVEASGMDITPEEIRKMMSAEQLDTTEVFTVTITHEDPVSAAEIANAMAEVAPAKIGEYVEGSSTKIIDYAKVPEKPASPSKSRNTVLGALAGAVLAVLHITLQFLTDVRIKDEEELNALFDLPVLSQIPAFSADTAKRRSGYGYENKNSGTVMETVETEEETVEGGDEE